MLSLVLLEILAESLVFKLKLTDLGFHLHILLLQELYLLSGLGQLCLQLLDSTAF